MSIEFVKGLLQRKKSTSNTSEELSSWQSHPVWNNLHPIGPHYVLIGNLKNWEFEYISDSVYDITGYTDQEVRHNPNFIFECVHTEDITQVRQLIEKLSVHSLALPPDQWNDHIYNIHYRIVRKNQSVSQVIHQWINLSHDENAMPLQIANIITDISFLNAVPQVRANIIAQRSSACTAVFPWQSTWLPSKKISERELEIAALLVEGKTSKEISEKLHISFHTVRTHRRNLLKKFGVRNTSEMIRLMLSNGLSRVC